MAQINYPYIPSYITVHLGPPGSNAENVTVPFTDYIKNVASSELYPTWPESALRANIYAIITYALNRIYTEHYRSQGYDFDITSSTQYDQAFVKNRDIFENISRIVDDIFNNYVVRQGNIEPFFTQFCNGTTVTCPGLSQWGTVTLANQGLTPYEILQYYYGDNINIVQNAPVMDVQETYPGTPLQIGDAGNDVKILQTQLNRITQNYPAIPTIEDVDGIFGVSTQNAVRKFQEIFNLPQTGVVDKSTWYKIKRYYNGVKQLGELLSEGVTAEEAEVPFGRTLSRGDQGTPVRIIQYYLNVIGYFNPDLDLLPIDGVFGAGTENAVKAFQSFYGLPADGVVGRNTWNRMETIYQQIIDSLAPGYSGSKAKLYPGYYLTPGMENDDVRDLQTYLALIGRYYAQMPEIPVTGYFGSQTENAVRTFQQLFGLPVNGVVGPITWNTIAQQYDFLVQSEQ